MSVKHLCKAAVCTALSVVMTRLLPGSFLLAVFGLSPLTVRLSLGLIPIYLAGVMLGPGWGAGVAAAADLIGYFINPMGGAYFFGFTLTAALSGAIPGLVTRTLGDRAPAIAFGITVAGLTSCLLNTFFLVYIYGTPFFTLLWPRLASAVLMTVVYFLVVWGLYRLLKKVRAA